MEKRHVRFENIQDALLWLMTNRFNKEDEAKLYDKYGNYFMHSSYNNIIEYYFCNNDEWDFNRISYEDFIDQFKGIVLENKI